MACCLNECWLLISEILWQSNFRVSAWVIILHNDFENYIFKITAGSPREQWVNRNVQVQLSSHCSSVGSADILAPSGGITNILQTVVTCDCVLLLTFPMMHKFTVSNCCVCMRWMCIHSKNPALLYSKSNVACNLMSWWWVAESSSGGTS